MNNCCSKWKNMKTFRWQDSGNNNQLRTNVNYCPECSSPLKEPEAKCNDICCVCRHDCKGERFHEWCKGFEPKEPEVKCEHDGCENKDLIIACHNHINTDYPCIECEKRKEPSFCSCEKPETTKEKFYNNKFHVCFKCDLPIKARIEELPESGLSYKKQDIELVSKINELVRRANEK